MIDAFNLCRQNCAKCLFFMSMNNCIKGDLLTLNILFVDRCMRIFIKSKSQFYCLPFF